jgi:copper transport protein
MLIKTKRMLFPFFMIILLFVVGVPTVWSHSFVIEESPAPSSYHENPPTEVKITFNSKVEKSLFTIKLYDEYQKEVTTQSAEISRNQKEIRLQLPALDGGKYQVEYYVISSNDGHPIKGSFIFQIVNSNEQIGVIKEGVSGITKPYQEQLEEEVIKNSTKLSNFSDWIIHIMRAIYYFGLLFLIGWIFLWRVVQNYAIDVKKKYLFWGAIVQMLHLVGLSSVILIQLNIFTINGISFAPDFPLQTSFGLLWIVSLFMSLIGFILLFKNQWFDIFWIVVMVFSKSLNGHALEFEPTIILIITNSIHLSAASIWAAGLLFIILFWRRHIIYVNSFLPQFSKYAFLSIVILSITGIFISYFYLSGFDLLFSERGILLMIKTVIVLLIIIVGAVIRSKMQGMKTGNLKKWIKFDFLLMFLIIIIVSILTYLNPLP